MMNINNLQSFCWTKIQAEAGQPLDEILRRKELERASGNGIFYWGVGNSLGPKTSALLSGEVDKVVFSRMLSAPKAIDVDPGAVYVWLNYKDLLGRVRAIPSHALVLSRAHSNTGVKDRHYALVCQTDEPLALRNLGTINTAQYRNYASSNPQIGDSQVTTILERDREWQNSSSQSGKIYEANLIANLVNPFFVALLNPVMLTAAEALELNVLLSKCAGVDEYLRNIEQLRKRLLYRCDFELI